MTNVYLHPAFEARAAKRMANELGCLMIYSGGHLRLKMRRQRSGVDDFERRARGSIHGRDASITALDLASDSTV